ncbi:exodeoxyribonuclease VII large subunit, partial [Escherichia coli]
MLPSQSPAIFTVSRLNQTVRLLLEHEMGQVWISGEISNFTQPASGHWYFTLKDDTAQVRCAMFRNSNRRVTFHPQHGQQVLVRANITLYEPRGDYQIIVESMQPAGEGLLQQKYEFQAAEGVELDTEALKEFEPVARELNLTNEQAQKLVDAYP